MLWSGFMETFQLLQIDCRWQGLIEHFKNETFFFFFLPFTHLSFVFFSYGYSRGLHLILLFTLVKPLSPGRHLSIAHLRIPSVVLYTGEG